MKIPRFIRPRKKLRATTTRRSLASVNEMDYEEMSEPNMKLSRALLIVLVLHVVAVAGIIAFNTIKSRQGAFPGEASAPQVAATETTAPAAVKTEPAATPGAKEPVALKALPVTTKTNSKEERATEPAIPKALPAGTDVYVVAKGDNPVKISRRLKVSESDLLEINHIDDPRKLQIGQKLIIPARSKSKKSE